MRLEVEEARTGFGTGLEAKLFVVVVVVVCYSVTTSFSIVTSLFPVVAPSICSLVAGLAALVMKFWRLALGIPR